VGFTFIITVAVTLTLHTLLRLLLYFAYTDLFTCNVQAMTNRIVSSLWGIKIKLKVSETL